MLYNHLTMAGAPNRHHALTPAQTRDASSPPPESVAKRLPPFDAFLLASVPPLATFHAATWRDEEAQRRFAYKEADACAGIGVTYFQKGRFARHAIKGEDMGPAHSAKKVLAKWRGAPPFRASPHVTTLPVNVTAAKAPSLEKICLAPPAAMSKSLPGATT